MIVLIKIGTAVMFFRHKNGKVIRVPQVANGGLINKGGIDVYYIPGRGNTNITAFKKVSCFQYTLTAFN
jgi:hypothetical protein